MIFVVDYFVELIQMVDDSNENNDVNENENDEDDEDELNENVNVMNDDYSL